MTKAGVAEAEEGTEFLPKFDQAGLLTAIVTDADSGAVLMVAHMNQEALSRTLSTGEAWFFSRSRGKLWRKGETSAAVQKIVEIRVDCDQDALWLLVRRQRRQNTCHTGRESCFYRRISFGTAGPVLEFVNEEHGALSDS